MARRRTANDTLFAGGAPKVDISPMIDLVFLLLIFFMIAATAITYKKDKRVMIPVATDSKVPELVDGRIVINVYQDGVIRDESGMKVYTEDDVERVMAAAKVRNVNSRLHLRADRRATHEQVKKVINASARGGVNNVIFSTYVTDK